MAQTSTELPKIIKGKSSNNNHRMNSHHHHHLHNSQTHMPEDSSSQTNPSRLMVTLEFCLVTMRCVRSLLQRIIASPWIDFVFTISIVLDTSFLAAKYHGMNPDVKHVLDVGNKVRPHIQTNFLKKGHESMTVVYFCLQVFTSVFTTDCILKMGATGTDFFRNG
jgi:hypothetical protein